MAAFVDTGGTITIGDTAFGIMAGQRPQEGRLTRRRRPIQPRRTNSVRPAGGDRVESAKISPHTSRQAMSCRQWVPMTKLALHGPWRRSC